MNEYKKNDSELGALWVKTSPRGEYMTGTINGQPVVVFRNDQKIAGSKAPDWRVMKPKPKAAAGASRPDDESIF